MTMFCVVCHINSIYVVSLSSFLFCTKDGGTFLFKDNKLQENVQLKGLISLLYTMSRDNMIKINLAVIL